MTRYRYLSLVLAGALLVAAAYAEPMYIHDKLVVSVYAEADQESDKVSTVESGDAVETLEKADLYTRVRLNDGREGWIKSSYLSAQPPAVLRLRELEKQGAAAPATTSSAELETLKAQNAALQSEVVTLKQAVATAARPAMPMERSGTSMIPSTNTGHLEGPVPDAAPFPIWQHLGWGSAVLAIGAALGFTWGYQLLARRIRRKYGNVKIY